MSLSFEHINIVTFQTYFLPNLCAKVADCCRRQEQSQSPYKFRTYTNGKSKMKCEGENGD